MLPVAIIPVLHGREDTDGSKYHLVPEKSLSFLTSHRAWFVSDRLFHDRDNATEGA